MRASSSSCLPLLLNRSILFRCRRQPSATWYHHHNHNSGWIPLSINTNTTAESNKRLFKSHRRFLSNDTKKQVVAGDGSLSKLLESTLGDNVGSASTSRLDIPMLATLSSRSPHYKQYLTNLVAVYTILEEELDATSIPAIKSGVVRQVWNPTLSQLLRRSQRLALDLEDLHHLKQDEYDQYRTGPSTLRKSMIYSNDEEEDDEFPIRVSPYSLRYIQSIRQAGENDRLETTGGARLLGHLYCRYYVDLILPSSSTLGSQIQLALQLPTTPRHLEFDNNASNDSQQQQPKENQESLGQSFLQDLNQAGSILTSDQIEDAKKECRLASQYRGHYFYSEDEARELMTVIDAAKGGWNYMLGWATSFGNNNDN